MPNRDDGFLRWLCLSAFITFCTVPAVSAQTTWQAIGPKPIAGVQGVFSAGNPLGPTFDAAGRVTAIVPDPTYAGRIFVGTANGGLWEITNPTNIAPTWNRISDGFLNPTQAIGAIALDASTSPPTLYVGTGEGNFGVDTYYGRGLFVSSDVGASWSEPFRVVANFEEQAFTQLALATVNGNRYLFAGIDEEGNADRAGATKIQGNPANDGLWRVTLGSNLTAKQYDTTNSPDFGGCTASYGGPCPADDIVVLGSNIFVAIDGHNVSSGHLSRAGSGVYLYDAANDTWTPVLTAASCQNLTNCPSQIGRIKLAGSGSTLYAMIGDPAGQFYSAFYQSANAGPSMTWTLQKVPCESFTVGQNTAVIDGTPDAAGAKNSSCGAVGTYSQSAFDQAMAVSPSNPQTVYFGGVGLYQSTNGGASWTFLNPGTSKTGVGGNITGSYHEDQHALAFGAANPANLFIGDDGGLFVDNGGTFTDVNAGLKAAQMYGVGIDDESPPRLLGGLQDNGALHFSTNKLTYIPPNLSWNQVGTGDVGVIPFAPNDSAYAYHTTAESVSLGYSTAGGISDTWYDAASGQLAQQFVNHGDIPLFLSPIAVSTDPAHPHRILYGGHFVYSVQGFANGGTITATTQSSGPLTPTACALDNGNCAIQDIEFESTTAGTNAWAVSANAPTSPGQTVNNTGYQVSCTTQANQDGVSWLNATGNLPSSGFPTGITISPFKQGSTTPVYLTMFAPAGSGTPANTIFETTSGCIANPTWTALPNVPTHQVTGETLSVLRLLVDNQDPTGQTLWAGTDIGIFETTDGGTLPWSNSGQSQLPPLPRVPVMDIAENPAGDIAIATHGSGAFLMTPTPSPTPTQTPTPTPTATPQPTATPTPSTSLPTFSGYSGPTEAECSTYPCTITLTAPAGAQPGDVLFATLGIGGSPVPIYQLSPGWQPVWLSNQGEYWVESSDPGGNAFMSETFSHIYGAGDNGVYSFKTWGNSSLAEFQGMLVDYRGADQNLNDYTAWGYGIYGDTSYYGIGPVAPYRPATLLNIFIGPQSEADEDEGIGITFFPPGVYGGPPLTVETQPSQLNPFLAADVGLPIANQSVGPYFEADMITGVSGSQLTGVWAGFQVAIPPP